MWERSAVCWARLGEVEAAARVVDMVLEEVEGAGMEEQVQGRVVV